MLYFVKISGEAIYGFIQLNCVYIWLYSTHEMISNSFLLSSWEKLVTIHNRFSLYFHLDFPSSFYDVNTCSSRFLDCSESSSPISSWIHVFLRTFIHFHPLFLKKIVSILHFLVFFLLHLYQVFFTSSRFMVDSLSMSSLSDLGSIFITFFTMSPRRVLVHIQSLQQDFDSVFYVHPS